MIKIRDDDIQKYSNDEDFDVLALNIGGTLQKSFVRVKSESIKELLDEITKENNSYVTYFDDLLKSQDFDNSKEFPLEYVSCMLKDNDIHFGSYNICETWGSRIANALSVPTVFNKNVSFNKVNNTLSIDCVKPNTKINSLKSNYFLQTNQGLKQIKCHCFADFDDWEKLFDVCFRNKSDLTDDEEVNNLLVGVEYFDYPFDRDTLNKCVSKFKKDFVKQYLLRISILHDKDFYPQNLMVVTDERTGLFKLGPCFDYEYILNDNASIPDIYFDENLKYIMKNYPTEAKEFGNAVFGAFFENGGISSQKLQKIFGNPDGGFVEHKQDNLAKNLNQFANCYLNNLDLLQNKDEESLSTK